MAKRTRPARRTARKPSKLEADLLLLWRFYNGPELVRELLFHPGRQWRADFAHPQAKDRLKNSRGEDAQEFWPAPRRNLRS